jgi:hypothetical protein
MGKGKIKLISPEGNTKANNVEVGSFSSELYRRFRNPEENRDLGRFLKAQLTLPKFTGGIEEIVTFSILGNLSGSSYEGGVQESEMEEFMKFVHLYGKVGHKGQKRKSGKPYDTHPIETMVNLAKRGVSYKGLCGVRLHDLVEEWAKKISEDDPCRNEKIRAFFYSIGIELYNFVRNSRVIKHKREFYRGIKPIMTMIANMSDIGNASYLTYLRNHIFYPREDKNFLLRVEPLKIWKHLGKFYNVKDTKRLVMDYTTDVHSVVLSDGFLGEKNKIKRRTIMGKLEDINQNLRDMRAAYESKRGLPLTFRIWEYFKGILIMHETGIKEHRLQEQSHYFGKIMDQCAELRTIMLREIEKDIKYLEGKLEEDYISFVKYFLEEYKTRRRAISGLTRPNKGKDIDAAFEAYEEFKASGKPIEKRHCRVGNPFDGTFIKYVAMMVENNRKVLENQPPEVTYKDLLLLKEVVLRMGRVYEKTGRQPKIERFSLNNLVENYKTLRKWLKAA